MAPTRSIQAGTQRLFWGQVDAFGFFAGTSGSVSAGATGEAMGKMLGIKTANPGPVEPDFVDVTGDDAILGTFAFEPNKLPQFVMELAAHDLNNQALLQGTLVEQLGDINLSVLQPRNAVYPDVCLIIQGKIISKDDATDGAGGWGGYILPRCTVVPLGRGEFAERSPAVDRYKVVVNSSTHKPWGVTIATADLGTTAAPIIEFTSDNPLVMERLDGNGVLQTFNLHYTPVSAAKTRVFDQTALLTPSSVDTAAKTFTLGSTPANGDKMIVLYEYSD